MHKETDAYFMHAFAPNGQPIGGITGIAGCCSYVSPIAPPAVGTWSHLAVTFDGLQMTYYLNGSAVAVASTTGPIQASTLPLWIGNNSYGEGFIGRIDEVRVYDRSLELLEIQADMTRSILPQGPDTTDPTVALTAPVAGTVAGVVNVQADAIDDFGVVGVQFLLDGAPLGAEDLAPPYELLWDTSAALNGAYVLSARARDGAGNTGLAVDVAVTVNNVPDTTDPTILLSAPSDGATLTGSVLIQANAGDNVGVIGVQFLLDGAPLGAEDLTAPYNLIWNTRLHGNGPYVLSATVRDAAGNTATAADVGVTVDNSSLLPVAAWAFDEGTAAVANDATGNGHTGAVAGAVWTPDGRFGSALVFDGLDDAVVVADAPGLALANAMTLSAWVRPSQLGSSWRPVLQKEPDAWLLHASSPSGLPLAGATLDGSCCTTVSALSALPVDVWSYLAVTYDGALLTYYVDGTAVATATATGLLDTTTAPLRIGNNSYAGEAFAGRIDEVRIYDWVLDESEIQSDMSTSILPQIPDVTDPTVSLTAPAPGPVAGAVSIEADAADDVGVVGVQFLLDGLPLGAEDLSVPYSLLWDTSAVSNGSYLLSARARDAAGNTGLAPDVAITVDNVPDTTDPTVSLSAPTEGATLVNSVLIQALADDNVGVAGVQFLLDGAPLGAEDLLAPYELLWNTRLHVNGPYVLSAQARDFAGNTVVATGVGVTLNNDPLSPVAAWGFDEGVGATA
ncbi:MAG: Ig-like domain-containing protein, partial [Planctomycetota bacterium]